MVIGSTGGTVGKKLNSDAQALSRLQGASRYTNARVGRIARKVARWTLIGLVVTIVAFIAVAIPYVLRINSELQNEERITEEVREALTISEDREPDDPFYMLLMGIDRDEGRTDSAEYGADDSNYRSDSIMLVRVDPKALTVTLVSIHRDTWLELDDYGMQKINAAFSYGGPAYMIETVEKLAGVDISHYAEVDMDGLAAIVNQLGGVTVNLGVDVYDPYYTGLDLKAGEQTLNGWTAALLCRARHAYDSYGDGDVYRAANQRAVISAIVKKILKSNPVTIASTVATLATYVNTDLDVATIVDLALQFRKLDVDNNIWSVMCPTAGYYDEELGIWYEELQEEEWDAIMKRVRAGQNPKTADTVDQTEGIAATSAE